MQIRTRVGSIWPVQVTRIYEELIILVMMAFKDNHLYLIFPNLCKRMGQGPLVVGHLPWPISIWENSTGTKYYFNIKFAFVQYQLSLLKFRLDIGLL